MIASLFLLLLFTPKSYHDSITPIVIKSAGIVESRHPYELKLFPTIAPIDYLGFVHE